MTASELLARRDDLRAEMTNAPAAKRDTQWFRDRENEVARLNRQLARMGAIPDPTKAADANAPGRVTAIIAPADHSELAAHAAAWQGEAPEGDDDPTADHDAQDEAWWTSNTPTRFDRYAVLVSGPTSNGVRRRQFTSGLIAPAAVDLIGRTSWIGHPA